MMIKKYKWTLLVGSLVILLPALVGLILWNQLPEQIVTHWGPDGQPDGWSGKGFAVFGLPCILLGFHWLCVLATTMDPRNKHQNPKPMALVLWICPVLSLLVGGLMQGSALGWEPDVPRLMTLFMGILFMVIGNYMPKCTRNYTLGIKIPWTLESEENWNATHRFAGKLWFAGGLVLLPCGFLPGFWPAVGCLVILAAMVALPLIFSWRFHRRETV